MGTETWDGFSRSGTTFVVDDPNLLEELTEWTEKSGLSGKGNGLRFELPSELTREEFDLHNRSNWHMPPEYKELDEDDLLNILAGLDRELYGELDEGLDEEKFRSDNARLERIAVEFAQFAERGMLDIIRFMLFFVATCRENGIVLGVGRGSSVASYILYLIGVSRINPLEYDLDPKEFFK